MHVDIIDWNVFCNASQNTAAEGQANTLDEAKALAEAAMAKYNMGRSVATVEWFTEDDKTEYMTKHFGDNEWTKG
jgi:hypothetical protein